ncbi:MAG: P-loop NTPase [Actinomycetota bacterium]|nr:P-loop NTPase [Actinomycetota bacterium]
MHIRLVIADPDPVFAREISAEFILIKEIEIVGSESDWESVERRVLASKPQTVIFGPGWAKTRVLTGVEQLRAKCSDFEAILVTAEYSTELRRQAAEIGFAGVFGIPIDSTELLLCLRRSAAGSSGKQQAQKQKTGRVITVFSTKGGVGKTVLTTNLAVALGQERQANVAILDMDLQFGDVGVMLNLMPKHTLHDLVGLKSVDLEQLKGLATQFNERVSALVAPLQPELADVITPLVIQPVFAWLRQAYDYVIIDTPPCFNDNVLMVLDETDELLLVSALDLPSLKNIKLCLQTLKLLNFPREKIKLVLNRFERNLGLSTVEVEEVFQEKISVQIPADAAVQLAVNKGVPVMLEAPKSPASKAIIELSAICGVARTGDKQKEVESVPA